MFFAFFCEVLFYGENQKTWTLAAKSFSLMQKTSSVVVSSYTTAIPSLILEQMSENLTRMPRSQEVLDRRYYELQKERLALFLQLSKEVQTRDNFVLQNYSEKKMRSKIKEQEKKVLDIEKKISENLLQVEKERKNRLEKIKKDEERLRMLESGELIDDDGKNKNSFAQFMKDFAGKNDDAPLEDVVLYKNDFNSLFEVSSDIESAGFDSYIFSKTCVDSNIQGLLTGTISVYGEFVSISVNLYRYPGGKLIASATDVGSSEDLKLIATNIAFQITPRIADSMPVELEFEIFPEEISASTEIMIDSVVYTNIKKITLPSGVHTIGFSHKGYISENTSYSFVGNRNFKISVDLQRDDKMNLNIAFKKPFAGSVFANGLFYGDVSDINRFSVISVNNRQILAHFVAENGESSDFIIATKLIQDENNLIVGGKPLDRSAYIEKRRVWMYRSYSLLIISLLPTFYCYGNFEVSKIAYGNKNISYDEARRWQVASDVCTGISIGCGALFVTELVRYLVAANSVLPKSAKKMNKKQLTKIKTQQQKALEKYEKERALLESENQAQEQDETIVEQDEELSVDEINQSEDKEEVE